MTKHSAAPWRVTTQGPALRYRIESAEGTFLFLSFGHSTNDEANAKLATRAPELLAALQALISCPEGSAKPLAFHDSGPHYDEYAAAWAAAHEAVYHATTGV